MSVAQAFRAGSAGTGDEGGPKTFEMHDNLAIIGRGGRCGSVNDSNASCNTKHSFDGENKDTFVIPKQSKLST